jgi:spore germination cell wall hydrolase CwlJ-like protein
MTAQDWHKSLLALVIWREARGESHEGKIAVGCVIRNRVVATHLADQWADVIEKRLQFSSMTAAGDAMLVQWPADNDPSWVDSMNVAEGIFAGSFLDATNGATLYCNLHVCKPAWADPAKQTATIGNHTFFKP